MLLEELDAELLDFDLATATLTVYALDDLGVIQTRTFPDMPGLIVDSGAVHPDSLSAFTELFEALAAGADRARENVLLLDRKTNAYAWATLSFHMRYDAQGRPRRALGIRRAMEDDHRPRSWYHELPESVWPHLIRAATFNLATRTMEAAIFRLEDGTRLVQSIPMDVAIDRFAASMFSPSDAQAYRALADPDALAARYESGRRWSLAWVCIVDDGAVKPIRIAVNVRLGARGHLIARVYTSTVEARVRWEASAEMSARRDPETMLYTRDYARNLARAIRQDTVGTALSAVSVIRAVEVEPAPRRIMVDLASAIGVLLGIDCVPYRCDDASIGVYVPEIESDDELWHRLSNAIASARASLVDANEEDARLLSSVRFIVESVHGTADYLDIQAAERAAHEACERRAAAAGDLAADHIAPPVAQYAVDSGAREPAPEPLAPDADLDALDPCETRALAGILSAMLATGSSRQAITRALHGLGAFHKARRVYMVSISAEDGMLSVPFEWADAGTMSIKARLSGTPAMRFPFIARNVTAAKPVFVSRPRIRPTRDGAVAKDDTWRFCLVPVASTRAEALAVCIDDPADHLDSWRLDQALSKRIVREWRLLSHRMPRAEGSAEAIELPGAGELERALTQGATGSWASCGALVVCIPDAGDLVKEHGLAYVISMVFAIKGALAADGCEGRSYQPGDAEFLALFPNTSYRSFVQRIAHIRTALVTSYPGVLRIGSAWSGGGNEARGTVEEARAIALHDNGLELAHAAPGERRGHPEPPAGDDGRRITDRFTVYLQPKIDMRTGTLAGAEALARYIDDDGRAVSPAGQIEQLEQTDEISTLDYFVFAKTLEILEAWLERGYPALPVSSNFSRATLLSPTALASILAIMSHHPAIPTHQMEMEVTESALDLGAATLRELVERYRSLGLRVALDDFGSHYSNMSVLANVRFDAIKLDQSIVKGLPDNQVAESMVKTIAEICADQGMQCIAEGVESGTQAEALVDVGCTVCQGFYYDKPLPPELFEQKYLARA